MVYGFLFFGSWVYPSWHHVGRWALHGLIQKVSLVFWKATYRKTIFNTTQCKSTWQKFLGVLFGVHLTAMEFPPRKDEEKMRDLTPTYLPTYLLLKSARDLLLTPTIRTLTHFPHTMLLILVTHFPQGITFQ
jgi:hypothetical protein